MAVADPRHPRASVGQPLLLGRVESCAKQAPQPGEDMRDGAGGWPHVSCTPCTAVLPPAPALAGCPCSGLGTGWVQRQAESRDGCGERGAWEYAQPGALSHPRRLVPRSCSAATEKLNFAHWEYLSQPWFCYCVQKKKKRIAQIMWHYCLYYLRQMSPMFFRLCGLMIGHSNVCVSHWRLN